MGGIGAYPAAAANDPLAYVVLAVGICVVLYGAYMVFFAKHPDDDDKE